MSHLCLISQVKICQCISNTLVCRKPPSATGSISFLLLLYHLQPCFSSAAQIFHSSGQLPNTNTTSPRSDYKPCLPPLPSNSKALHIPKMPLPKKQWPRTHPSWFCQASYKQWGMDPQGTWAQWKGPCKAELGEAADAAERGHKSWACEDMGSGLAASWAGLL